MELSVGDKIPHFELTAQDGSKFNSREVLSRGPLVLFFYPMDHTPGCTAEACNFRDAHSDFVALGATVAGVSPDSKMLHKSFAGRLNLPYPLLTDKHGMLAKSFHVKRQFFNLIPGRSTYVIDEEGIVQLAYDKSNAAHHHSKALEILKKLKIQ